MHKKPSKKRDVKYPVAFDLLNEELVDIGCLSEKNKSNIICPECSGRFIAVINHATPHFKHYGDFECLGTVESYIHKIVKELLKKVSDFELPELLIEDLPEEYLRNFWQMRSKLLDANIPLNQQREFINGLKKNLTEVKKVIIDNVEIEKTIKTSKGDIRVDVVAHIGNKILFIEPYYSNRINEDKKEKIRLTNIPTLSISLKEFIMLVGFNFRLSDLKKWLFIDNSKNWIYLNDELYQKHINSYKEYLWSEIQKQKRRIILNEIFLLKKENVEKEKYLKDLKTKFKAVKSEISDALKQIDRLSKDLEDFK